MLPRVYEIEDDEGDAYLGNTIRTTIEWEGLKEKQSVVLELSWLRFLVRKRSAASCLFVC